MNNCNQSDSNVFEVDLGELEITDSQREIIASKIQRVVLQEIAAFGIESDFSARILSPGKFPDIRTRGIWIEPGRLDGVFANIRNKERR